MLLEQGVTAAPGDAPVDAKSADTKPTGVKPADAKPADAKPADAKPADAQPAEAQPAEATPADAQPAGRDDWHARLDLGFERDARGHSMLAHRSHSGPLRIQKALWPEGPGVCHAVIVHPPGGIAGGDRLAINVAVGAAAHALITTPGATKWYKAPHAEASQEVRISVAADAILEWMPQESIVFNRAGARSSTQVELVGGALYIGWEILCFGRTAAGETFDAGSYRQRWQIRRAGAPLWNEAGVLEGGSRLLASPAGMAGLPVTGTLVAAGRPVSASLLEAARGAIDALPQPRNFAATRMPDLFIARYRGAEVEQAREGFLAIWRELRPALAGVAASVPRIWRT